MRKGGFRRNISLPGAILDRVVVQDKAVIPQSSWIDLLPPYFVSPNCGPSSAQDHDPKQNTQAPAPEPVISLSQTSVTLETGGVKATLTGGTAAVSYSSGSQSIAAVDASVSGNTLSLSGQQWTAAYHIIPSLSYAITRERTALPLKSRKVPKIGR